MLLPALIVCILINLSSCSGNNNENEKSALAANDSALFYPVQEYFNSQLKTVDSNTSILLIYTDTTGKKDSSVIDEPALTNLSKPFFENNISDPAIKKYYRESVFQDETTASYTFSYTSLNNSLPLQNLDVLLDTVTQRVKRVFITQTKTIADTSITEKMGWKTDQGFFINRIYHLPGNKETIQQINVVWKHNN